MLRQADHSYSRRDTVALATCILLAVIALFLPSGWSQGIAGSFRETFLAPLVWLQARAEEGRTSRFRFRAVTAQRDSAAVLAQSIPVLQAENQRLRQLLTLRSRLRVPYVAAEVMHQAHAADDRMLLIDAGREGGLAPFQPVIAPEGLIGAVWEASQATATVMTWAHPEFRVSAFTADGRVFGMVAPSGRGAASEAALEFRAASYRDTLQPGTLVLSSGLGGVYPKGVPVGTVVGVAREQAGWERVYALRPAANPSAVAHVLVLTGTASVADAFPGDSILAAVRADSLARVATADSLLRVRIADSVKSAVRDSAARAVAAAASAAAPPAAPPAARPTPGPAVRPDSARRVPRADTTRRVPAPDTGAVR